jgi:hypothetical protein
MKLHDRTDPSLDLLQRFPTLPQVDLTHSTQVRRPALMRFDAFSRPIIVRCMP